MKQHQLIDKQAEEKLMKAIEKAEKNTSGEIRVHIEKKCSKGVLDRAAEMFASLQMHKTKLRNGVLFYLALEDRQFAVLGDAGINMLVPPDFWEDVKEKMKTHFQAQNFIEGLEQGIELAGQQLKTYFPYKEDDKDELSNEISFG